MLIYELNKHLDLRYEIINNKNLLNKKATQKSGSFLSILLQYFKCLLTDQCYPGNKAYFLY